MKTIIFLFFLSSAISTNYFLSQDEPTNFIETQAKITELDTQISGRRSSVTATVNYTTSAGENITSKVRLLHIPFLGSFKEVGDSISIEYEANNPYIIKSKADSFFTNYGLYILIALGLFISYKRLRGKTKVEA